MSSSLSLTPILVAYPNFYNSRINNVFKFKKTDTPLYYSSAEDFQCIQRIKSIKDFQKLRLVNNHLVIDNRYFQTLRRWITKDNRWIAIEHLKSLSLKNEGYHKYICDILDVLSRSTYKNDKKWIDEADKIKDKV